MANLEIKIVPTEYEIGNDPKYKDIKMSRVIINPSDFAFCLKDILKVYMDRDIKVTVESPGSPVFYDSEVYGPQEHKDVFEGVNMEKPN